MTRDQTRPGLQLEDLKTLEGALDYRQTTSAGILSTIVPTQAKFLIGIRIELLPPYLI